MPLIQNQILSSDNRFPYNDSIQSFFNSYHVSETVGAYYFYPWPEGCNTGTSVKDLTDREYEEDVIIWIPMDSFVDEKPYNYYTTNKIQEIVKLEQYCNTRLNKKFILLPNFYNAHEWVDSENLVCDRCMLNTQFNKRYKRCDTKSFGNKNWICLNRRDEPHRVGLMSLLLSMELDQYGLLTASDFDLNIINESLLKSYFRFKYQNERDIIRGLNCLLNENYEMLNIDAFPDEALLDLDTGILYDDVIDNYHQNLYSVYKTTAVEMISCSTFFEPTPTFGEKEIQSVYGKNFPIFIGSKGTARMFRDDWGMDIFDDIVNHSYDEIDDPTERLMSAIQLNLHLLKNQNDVNDLWVKHQKRFNLNCDRMDLLLYDKQYQQEFDYDRIKSCLKRSNVSYTQV